jgi:flagellar protein FlaG
VGGPPRKPEHREGTDRPDSTRPAPANDREQLERVAKLIEQAAAKRNHRVGITLDEQTNEPVISVTDKDTGKLIRQIPPKEIRQLSRKLAQLAGLLLDEEA